MTRPCRLHLHVSHAILLLPERCLEDHELVVQVENTMASESRFLFRKNYAKYEFFRNPTVSLASSGVGCGAPEILRLVLGFNRSTL